MMTKTSSGHPMALFCVLVWGSTFVVSKSLMAHLQPVQLMLLRFIFAYGALWIIHPIWYFRWQEEGRFVLMALFANTLYCWAENTAITLTQTTNVSILVTTSPIITALALSVFHRDERLSRNQYLGFAIAFAGVVMVVLNGALTLRINPAGDLLALLAAASWAAYGLLLRHWSDQYNSVLITRKLMFYGAITTLPLLLLNSQPIDFAVLLSMENVAKLAFLAFVGSAACYLLWSMAVQRIGILKANLYIYMVPLVTLLVSALILREHITPMGFAGMLCVISGMILGTLQKSSG